jgi:hypothetical protein
MELFARSGSLESLYGSFQRRPYLQRIAVVHFVVDEGAFDRPVRVESQRRLYRTGTKVGDNDLLTHEWLSSRETMILCKIVSNSGPRLYDKSIAPLALLG